MSYHPEWLGKNIVGSNLPWERAQKDALSSFLNQYTLHDSYWIGLYLMPQRKGILVVRWDTFWTKGKVPYPGSAISEWPILIFQLSGLQQVEIALVEDGIAGASSQPIKKNEQGEILVSTSVVLHHTQVNDHSDGKASFVHDSVVEILCLSRNGDILEVPMQSTEV